MGLDLDQFATLQSLGGGLYRFTSPEPGSTPLEFKIPEVNEDGEFVFDGNVVLQGGLQLPPAIEVTISSNTDNLSIPGFEGGLLIRFDVTGNYDLTGLVPPGVAKGSVLFLVNVGTGNLKLKVNSASSLAQNRFASGNDKTFQTQEAGIAAYDTIAQRWIIFGITV